MASHQEGSSSYASSSNPTRRTWTYDIFLSFRGEDTHRGFTSHLYHALIRSGFSVFRDDELRRGDSISQELLQAIEESRSAIVILSENYASSSWCLDELQYILASRNNQGQTVFPIFYDVEPSDVRHQQGRFGEAFATREEKFQKDQSKVQNWRNSLTEVANLFGFESRQYRTEAELIDQMVAELIDQMVPVFQRLSPYRPFFTIIVQRPSMTRFSHLCLFHLLYFSFFLATLVEVSERNGILQKFGTNLSLWRPSAVAIKVTLAAKLLPFNGCNQCRGGCPPGHDDVRVNPS